MIMANPIMVNIGIKPYDFFNSIKFVNTSKMSYGDGVRSFSQDFIPVEISAWKKDLSPLSATMSDLVSKDKLTQIDADTLRDKVKTISDKFGLGVKVEMLVCDETATQLPMNGDVKRIVPILVLSNFELKARSSVTLLINGEEESVVSNLSSTQDTAKLLSLEGKAKLSIKGPPVDIRSYNIVFKGDAASDNVVIGRAVIVKSEHLDLDQYPSINLKAEAEKLNAPIEKVLESTIQATNDAFDKVIESFSKGTSGHFDYLQQFLVMLKQGTLDIMSERGLCAADAARAHLSETWGAYKTSPDEKRRSMYADFSAFLAEALAVKHNISVSLEEEVLNSKHEKVILFTQDVSLGQIGIFKLPQLRGLVRVKGSTVDHVANRTRESNKGGLTGVKNILDEVMDGDLVAVDGRTGQLIVRLNTQKMKELQQLISSIDQKLENLKKLREFDLIIPGDPQRRKRKVGANVTNEKDVEEAIKQHYDYIGLVRTEVYLGTKADGTPRESEPSIRSQQIFYNKVIAAAQGKLVRFRTLDPDDDKPIGYLATEEMSLGVKNKGLALCLEKNTPMNYAFRNQIESFLRTRGACEVMFPVVKSKEEVVEAFKIVYEIKNRLIKDGVKLNNEIDWGVMVEHSAILNGLIDIRDMKVLLMQDEDGEIVEVKESDVKEGEKIESFEIKFFSVGTNDLIADLLNIDRRSPNASKFMNGLDPKVIKALKQIMDELGTTGNPPSICGDYCNDWRRSLVALAMGYESASLMPSKADVQRKLILSSSMPQLDIMLNQVLKMRSAQAIEKFIEKFTEDRIKDGTWDMKDIELLIFPQKDQ
jgi:phosphoenolpyruvate-protein phosphotransferase (PTS system enzyme I)